MDLLMRRRTLIGGKPVNYIELPDYVRIDFDTISENEVVRISYGNCSVSDGILDGADVSIYNSGSYKCVTVPLPGEHTLYCKIASTTATNSGFGYFARKVSYIRLPYNITDVCPSVSIHINGWSSKDYGQIDILDSRPWMPLNNNTLSNNIDFVNVPIGSKVLYEEAGFSQGRLNKINEVDFKFKVQ